jgi:hypothetical protein
MNDRQQPDFTARLDAIEKNLQHIHDREAIHAVYLHYGRGIDRLDEHLYMSAFWPDARIHYGAEEAISRDEHWSGHMLHGHRDRMHAWGHLLTNEFADIDGDTAHVEIYVTPMWVVKEPSPSDVFWSGRYIDRLDRRDGEWRIAVREFMPHFAMKVDTSVYDDGYYIDPRTATRYTAWGDHDPSYLRPLEPRAKEIGAFGRDR